MEAAMMRVTCMVAIHGALGEWRQLTWSMRSIASFLMLHAEQMRRDSGIPQRAGEHGRLCDLRSSGPDMTGRFDLKQTTLEVIQSNVQAGPNRKNEHQRNQTLGALWHTC